MTTVVVTGASSGIGLACVKASLAAGHRIIATARRAEDLTMLTELGAQAVHLELTKQSSVHQAAKAILALSDQHIDALFNNAGYGLQVAMEDAKWEHLQTQHLANVVGPIELTNQLLPALQPGSKLIFNGSILGIISVSFRGPYCMSKHALEAAVDSYRLELESRKISVHLIQPGPIEADFRSNALAALEENLGDRQTRLDYSNHLARLKNPVSTKGTLPASSVAEIYLGIIAGTHRKTRYLVTNTAKAAATLKRLLGDGFHPIARRSEPARLKIE